LGFAVFGGMLLIFRRVWWFGADPEVLCGLGVVVVSCSSEWQWTSEVLVTRWWNTGEICSSSCFGFDAVAVCKGLRVRVGLVGDGGWYVFFNLFAFQIWFFN
jgi:hypothetical protein